MPDPTPTPKPTETQRITKERAVELATAEFETEGRRRPADYDITVDEEGSAGPKWVVLFDRKGPYRMPGGRHIVTVEKQTGKAVFMPGE